MDDDRRQEREVALLAELHDVLAAGRSRLADCLALARGAAQSRPHRDDLHLVEDTAQPRERRADRG